MFSSQCIGKTAIIDQYFKMTINLPFIAHNNDLKILFFHINLVSLNQKNPNIHIPHNNPFYNYLKKKKNTVSSSLELTLGTITNTELTPRRTHRSIEKSLHSRRVNRTLAASPRQQPMRASGTHQQPLALSYHPSLTHPYTPAHAYIPI